MNCPWYAGIKIDILKMAAAAEQRHVRSLFCSRGCLGTDFCHSCQVQHFFLGKAVKDRNHPSNANDRNDSPKSNPYRTSRKKQADPNGERDIQQVKAVFCKSHLPAGAVRDGLHNTIPRIRDDTHVQRHGCPDAGEDHSQKKDEGPSGKTAGETACICGPKFRDPV